MYSSCLSGRAKGKGTGDAARQSEDHPRSVVMNLK